MKTNSGVFKIAEPDYNEVVALRSSAFKDFCKSPALYKNREENKKDDDLSNRNFAKGRVIHCGLLEPEKLRSDFVISKLKTTRAAEFVKTYYSCKKTGKTLLSANEWDDCKGVIKAGRENPMVKAAIDDCYVELSATATIEGVCCKIRMDIYDPESGIITDIKSTSSSMERFKYAITDFGYDISAAFYLLVAEEAFKGSEYKVPTEFRLLAISKSEPYEAKMFQLSERRMEETKEYVRGKLREYKKCLEEDTWEHPINWDIEIID